MWQSATENVTSAQSSAHGSGLEGLQKVKYNSEGALALTFGDRPAVEQSSLHGKMHDLEKDANRSRKVRANAMVQIWRLPAGEQKLINKLK